LNSDRFKRALEAFLLAVFARIDYLALYPAKVVSQNGDGSVDVQPDDARLPGMTSVPLRFGLPGLELKVTSGARVLIGFENGDPRRPVATAWEKDGFQSVAIGGGTQPIARVGDTVSVSIPAGTPIAGQLAGQPFTGAWTQPVICTGTILTGNQQVKA